MTHIEDYGLTGIQITNLYTHEVYTNFIKSEPNYIVVSDKKVYSYTDLVRWLRCESVSIAEKK